MSTTSSRPSGKLVEEDIPCIDSGSWFKMYYNVLFKEPFNAVKVVDDVPVHVVGSDVHCGKDSKLRVKENAAKLHYFSYRNRFSRLPNGSSTDTRWGCLARTGQMLLATALLRFSSAGKPTWGSEEAESIKSFFRTNFMDRPDAPFGLHRIEEEAHKDGAEYATFFSPTQMAVVLTILLEDYKRQGGHAPHAVCAKERDLNVPHLRSLLDGDQSVVIFLPLALGIDAINEKYYRAFFDFLDTPTSCGIAGGVQKASYYFFGHQDKNVIYYDPHYVQRAYRSTSSLGEARSQYKMSSIKRLNPFMVAAFFVSSDADLDGLLQLVDSLNKEFPFPLISITGWDRTTSVNPGTSSPSAGTGAGAVVPSPEQSVSNPLSPSF